MSSMNEVVVSLVVAYEHGSTTAVVHRLEVGWSLIVGKRSPFTGALLIPYYCSFVGVCIE